MTYWTALTKISGTEERLKKMAPEGHVNFG